MRRKGPVARLAAAVPQYVNMAWHGLVVPKVRRREPPLVCQAFVLSERGLLLSVRSDLHGWELPGGNAYPGENDEEVLEREVREETGLRVEIESRVGDYRRTGFAAHTARVFACRVRGGVLRPSSETPIVAWFDPEDLPETLFPWYRVPIADALARLPQPVERQEHLGLASVLAGMCIDVRMRSSNLRAGQVTGRR